MNSHQFKAQRFVRNWNNSYTGVRYAKRTYTSKEITKGVLGGVAALALIVGWAAIMMYIFGFWSW